MSVAYKIYQPYAREKAYRFRYYPKGSKPKNFVHGLERLKKQVEATRAAYKDQVEEEREVWLKKNNRFTLHKAYGENEPRIKVKKLIICTGGSDGLNVACLGYDVCWMNSEEKRIDYEAWQQMRDLAENIYLLFDTDATGQANAHEIGLQHLEIRHIILPADEFEKNNFTDWRGNRIKDVRDFLNHFGKKEFDALVEQAMPYQFWFWTKSGPDFDSSVFYNFLNRNGIWKYSNEKQRRMMDVLIQRNENIVREIEAEDVHSFGNKFLEERNTPRQVRNTFHRNTLTELKQLKRNLKFAQPSFAQASNTHQVMFFQNEAWIITADEIKAVKHKDAGCCVWEEDIFNHRVSLLQNDFFEITKQQDEPYVIASEAKQSVDDDGQFEMEKHLHKQNGHSKPDAIKDYSIKLNPDHGFDYLSFLRNTSLMHWQDEQKTPAQILEEERHLINRLYVLGYLCHTNKNAAKAWAVFANDYWLETGRAFGRSGKGLFMQLPRYFMRTVRINGRDKKLNDNKHWSENVTRWTRYLWFEDCDPKFDYSAHYNSITGEIIVNPKGIRSQTLDFMYSPKIAFDSNYPNNNLDPSTKGRMLYTTFSDYYHEASIDGKFSDTRRPVDEFKHQFFNDWKNEREEHWSLLANLVARCIQFYLQTGNDKLNPPMEHINENELSSSLPKNFDEWATEYFTYNMNKEVVHAHAYQDYCEKIKSQISSNTWTRAMKRWTVLRKYELNPVDWCNDKKNRRHKATSGEHKGEFLIMVSDGKVAVAQSQSTPF